MLSPVGGANQDALQGLDNLEEALGELIPDDEADLPPMPPPDCDPDGDPDLEKAYYLVQCISTLVLVVVVGSSSSSSSTNDLVIQ